MKRIPKKSQVPKPNPITIKFNPAKKYDSIVMPKIKYEIVATAEMKTKFTGEITPIPTVLLYILSYNELKLFSAIMDSHYKYGKCTLTMDELAMRMRSTRPSINSALCTMRTRGLLLEEPYGRGNRKARMLNFKAIQHISKLVDGEDPRIYARIASSTRKTDIMSLTKEDIRNAYDNKVLHPDHDPAEEEEYD